MLPKDLRWRSLNLLYAFVITVVSWSVLYHQRVGLVEAIKPSLPAFMQGWVLLEWLPMFIFSPFGLMLGVIFYKYRCHQRRGNAPDENVDLILAMNTKLDELVKRMDWFEKVVTPVETKKGVELQYSAKKAADFAIKEEKEKASVRQEINSLKEKIEELKEG